MPTVALATRPSPAPVLRHGPRTAVRPALPAGVQAKRQLGGAHDEAEHQADRLAARALSRPLAPAAAAGPATRALQRAVLRRALQPGPAAGPAPGLALDEAPERAQALPDTLDQALSALTQSGGEPLPPPVRQEMEARFGIDLGAVRLHTDARAVALSEALHAHAFTAGEHIAFNAGRFQPEQPAGRFLLAHELAHVAQQRGQAAQLEADGSAAPAPVRRGFWGDLYDGVADTLGDIADWAVDQVREFGWRLLETISPSFARTVREIVDEGLLPWLGRQVARAWDGFIGGLRALVPFEGPQQLITLFAGLAGRAAQIVAALASGRCEPLMAALGELKTFVTQTVGVAWDRLTEFLRPIGAFFTDLWAQFGLPAVRWLSDFGGEVWAGIQSLGARLWEWIRPVREAASRIWTWFSELLFGRDSGEDTTGSAGGVLAWISAQAGEAWDWVRERTRPVWQPVADLAGRVAELIPPAFVRQMGEQAQQLASGLDSASAGMDGGEGVPAARQSLASALPGVQAVIAALRGLLLGAGHWLGERIGAVAAAIDGLVTRLRASEWLSWLASAFGWLTDALGTLLRWAREGVAALFDALVQGFDALSPFLQMVIEAVRKLITVATDLMQLPLLIVGGLWQRVPACIREPIERFLREQILARIPIFGQFFTDPTLWPRVEQTALRILRRVFVDGDLMGAAWAFFQAVLGVLGIPAQLVVQILAKAARALGAILGNPIGFLINLLRALRAGFGLFFERIGTHLLGGVTGWLFGQLQEAGIRPPADFSLRAVLGFVFDVMGLTIENVLRRLSDRLGPTVVERLRRLLSGAEGVWRFVSVLMSEGVGGLWRELQERIGNLWDSVVQGVSAWITEAVINRASRWLMSLLDPSGIMAVVNSLVAIYNAIESFVQYLRQMLEIVSRVLDGVLDIARGALDGAAASVERALGQALPVAIGFLANQLGLGRLGQRIGEILGRVQALVGQALDWLIERAIRLGQSLIEMARRGVDTVRAGVARLREWWRARRAFRVGAETHQLYVEGSGASAHLMLASTPTSYERFLENVSVPPEKEADKRRAITLAAELGEAMRAASAESADRGDRGPRRGAATPAVDHAALIDAKLGELAAVTALFMPALPADARSSDPQYGSMHANAFGSSVRVDRLTRVHQRGSEPASGLADARGHWNKLRLRYRGGSTLYVRGHLLNDNLGGPGDDWRNLTPLTQDANNRGSGSMLHGFETDVKNAIDAGKAVRFVVTAHYGRSPIDATAARDAGETVKAEIAEAEAHVPQSVSCHAVELRPDGSEGPVVATAPSVDNSLGTEAPQDYQLAPGTAAIDVPVVVAALRAELRAAVSADPTLTWAGFRGSERREGRLRRLGEVAEDQVTTLQTEFSGLRTTALVARARSAGVDVGWGDFRREQGVYGGPSGLADAQVEAIRRAFDTRTTPAPAPAPAASVPAD